MSTPLGRLLAFLTTCFPGFLSHPTAGISTVTFFFWARGVYLIFFQGPVWIYIFFYCPDHYPKVKRPSSFLSCVISLILHREIYTYNLHRILPDHSIGNKSFFHWFLIPRFLRSTFLLLLRLLVFSIIGEVVIFISLNYMTSLYCLKGNLHNIFWINAFIVLHIIRNGCCHSYFSSHLLWPFTAFLTWLTYDFGLDQVLRVFLLINSDHFLCSYLPLISDFLPSGLMVLYF